MRFEFEWLNGKLICSIMFQERVLQYMNNPFKERVNLLVLLLNFMFDDQLTERNYIIIACKIVKNLEHIK